MEWIKGVDRELRSRLESGVMYPREEKREKRIRLLEERVGRSKMICSKPQMVWWNDEVVGCILYGDGCSSRLDKSRSLNHE